MILNIFLGCLIVGIFCHANLPGYPETLNTTLKNKARLSKTSRDIEGNFKEMSSTIPIIFFLKEMLDKYRMAK